MNLNLTRGEILRSALTLCTNEKTLLIEDEEFINNYFSVKRYRNTTKENYVFVFKDLDKFNEYSKRINAREFEHKHIKYRFKAYLMYDNNELDTEFLTTILNIIKNINDGGKTIVTESYENILNNINKKQLDEFNKQIKNLPNASLNLIDKKIDNNRLEIDNLLNKLDELKEKIKQLLFQRGQILISEEEHPIEKTINYIKRCPQINSVKTDANCLFINTNYLPIYYVYQDEIADKYIKNIHQNEKTREILINALTSQDKYIMHISPKLITIQFTQQGKLTYNINDINSEAIAYISYLLLEDKITNINPRCFKNKHWDSYTCLGSFKIPIEEACSESNALKLLISILQYLETINIADYAGVKWLDQSQHLLLDIEKNQFFVLNCKDGSKTYIHNSLMEISIPYGFIERELL